MMKWLRRKPGHRNREQGMFPVPLPGWGAAIALVLTMVFASPLAASSLASSNESPQQTENGQVDEEHDHGADDHADEVDEEHDHGADDHADEAGEVHAHGAGQATDTDLPQYVTGQTVLSALSPLGTITRWLILAALALWSGFFLFHLLVWRPVFDDDELEPEETAVQVALVRDGVRLTFLASILLALSLVLALISLVQNGMNVARPGLLWSMRLAIFVFSLALWRVLQRRWTNGRTPHVDWPTWAGLALGLILALTVSLASHSANLAVNSGLATAVDLAHVLAASIWAGGLILLALALWRGRRLGPHSRSWLTLNLVLNFSAVAVVAVGFLLVSGGYLAWQHAGSWIRLFGTAYGLMLLAKVSLALLVLLLAAFNLLVVRPRLNRAYDEPETATAARAMRTTGRIVGLEVALVLLILVIAGALSDQTPGREAALLGSQPGQAVVSQAYQDWTVRLIVSPALLGHNQFEVEIRDPQNSVVGQIDEVSLRFKFLDQPVGIATAAATAQPDGHFSLEGPFVNQIGTWQADVVVPIPGEEVVFVPFQLSAGVDGRIRDRSGVRLLDTLAYWTSLLDGGGTGAFLVLFAIVWGFVATRAAGSAWQLVPLLAISLLTFWVGANQLFAYVEQSYDPARFLTNPYLADAESIAAGRQVFENQCVPCHGEAGRGDGPAGVALSPPPADFGAGHTDTHRDGDLYVWIGDGIEGSAMPAFGGQLSRDEIWHVINYVRRLSAEAAWTSARTHTE